MVGRAPDCRHSLNGVRSSESFLLLSSSAGAGPPCVQQVLLELGLLARLQRRLCATAPEVVACLAPTLLFRGRTCQELQIWRPWKWLRLRD